MLLIKHKFPLGEEYLYGLKVFTEEQWEKYKKFLIEEEYIYDSFDTWESEIPVTEFLDNVEITVLTKEQSNFFLLNGLDNYGAKLPLWDYYLDCMEEENEFIPS